MKEIIYDKHFEKVMKELQFYFGWYQLDLLPNKYKDLLNDTIKAVKNCSIPAVVGRSEQLKAFAVWLQKRMWEGGDKDFDELVDEFLSL